LTHSAEAKQSPTSEKKNAMQYPVSSREVMILKMKVAGPAAVPAQHAQKSKRSGVVLNEDCMVK